MITSDTAPETASAELGRGSLISGYVLGMLAFMSSALWIPAAGADFFVPQFTTGIIASIEMTLSAIVCLGVAPHLTRISAHVLLIAGAGTVIATTTCTILLPLPIMAFAALRAAEGAAAGLCVAVTSMQASQSANPQKLFGLFLLAQTICAGLFFGIASSLLPRYGHRAVFALLGAGSILALLIFALSAGRLANALTRAPPRGRVGNQTPAAPRGLLAACIGIGLVFLVNTGMNATVSAFGAQAGLSLAQSGRVLAVCTFLPIIASAIAVALAGRMVVKLILGIGAVGSAISLLGLGFSGSPVAFELTLGASFFFFPFVVPSMQSGIARMDPDGRAAAAAQATIMVGFAVAPALGTGVVRESSPSVWAIAGACAVVAGITLVARVIPNSNQ